MQRAMLLAALLGAATLAQANPTVETNGMMTSRDGRTLYTFDKDAGGTSNCSGACLAAWPAFTVGNPKLAGGDFSIIVRDDGVQQWAFKGRPLYFYAGDAKAGDANGDNQGGVWHVLRSAPKKAARNADTGYGGSYSYTY